MCNTASYVRIYIMVQDNSNCNSRIFCMALPHTVYARSHIKCTKHFVLQHANLCTIYKLDAETKVTKRFRNPRA